MSSEPLAITFDDLYVGRGTLDMAFHPELTALNGRPVVLSGVLAPIHDHHDNAHGHDDHPPVSAPLLIMDEIGQCPDCAPAPVATVQVSGLDAVPVHAIPGQTMLTIMGTLEFGYAVDKSGHASFLRLTRASLVD
ncbi:MAG: hypothetical protein R3D62_03140 [Xanthobacteraceae bacterium]